MQKWQKLDAEHVVSKHYAESLHRLAAVLHILHSVDPDCACLLIHMAPYITDYL